MALPVEVDTDRVVDEEDTDRHLVPAMAVALTTTEAEHVVRHQ